MKRLLFLALLFLGAPLQAADLTAGVSTANDQKYNQRYRDSSDGTTAVVRDVITANSVTATAGTQNTIKSSGGYVEHFVINAPCLSGNYVLADAAASAASYVTVISTIAAASTQGPTVVPIKGRFTNGIAFNVPFSSCTVTISYR